MHWPVDSVEEAFRDEVATFLQGALTEDMRRSASRITSIFFEFDCALAWQKKLHAKGWGAPAWPKEYGGPGWSPAQQLIFQEECARAGAPLPYAIGLQMLGPVLMEYGTPAQKARYLPPIINGDDIWCQGYSEPNAGSDLAALATSARREGDSYIVNGQKIWTSYAHRANRMFALVRTADTKKPQAGISFLLIDDMAAPGLTIRPIKSLDGHVEQCEVFFDDVRVPVENLVGEENDGWGVAKFLLQHERGGYSYYIAAQRLLAIVDEVASTQQANTMDADMQVLRARLQTKLEALRFFEYRQVTGDSSLPASAASMCKLAGTELAQVIDELAATLMGPWFGVMQGDIWGLDPADQPIGPAAGAGVMRHYLNNRAATIYGGSAQIQRNLIARELLAG